MTYSQKLRLLADWFDWVQSQPKLCQDLNWTTDSHDVQDDLRNIAIILENFKESQK